MGKMTLVWDQTGRVVHADVDGLGRYSIQRIGRYSRDFRVYLNGKPTSYMGTVDQCKKSVVRVLEAFTTRVSC